MASPRRPATHKLLGAVPPGLAKQGRSPIGKMQLTAGRSHRLTSGGIAVPLEESLGQGLAGVSFHPN